MLVQTRAHTGKLLNLCHWIHWNELLGFEFQIKKNNFQCECAWQHFNDKSHHITSTRRRRKQKKKKRNAHSILIWKLLSYGYIRFYFFLRRRKKHILIFSFYLCCQVSWPRERWEFRYFHIKMSFRWATVRTLSTKHTFARYLLAFFIDFDRNFVFHFYITIKHESHLNGNQYWNFGEEKRDMSKYIYLFNERTLNHTNQKREEKEVEKQFTCF